MHSNEPKMSDVDVEAGGEADAGVGENDVEILARQLGECESKLADMRDTVLRERADLDNQRKRLQRDVEQARKFANEKLLADLLPVVDNLSRGLDAEGEDIAVLREGIELTLRELMRLMQANGVLTIGEVGQKFDPEKHQAMQVIDVIGPVKPPSGEIVQVMQKGYVLNARLLRPALVSVSK